jgi:type II secretory pathway pseudopilin PulG
MLRSIDGEEQSLTDYGNAKVWQSTRPELDRQSTRLELDKGLAVASLVVGIVSFLTFTLLGFAGVAGIILGAIAISKVNRNPTRYGGKGLAIAGLVLSVSSFLIVAPLGIIAAIAIPNFLAARRAANEVSSIVSLREISSAQAKYYDLHQRFGTLDELAAEQLIKPSLTPGIRNGYKFGVKVVTRDYREEPGFEAVAAPVSYPNSGLHSFYIDETGIMRNADARGGLATKYDSPLDWENQYSPAGNYSTEAQY